MRVRSLLTVVVAVSLAASTAAACKSSGGGGGNTGAAPPANTGGQTGGGASNTTPSGQTLVVGTDLPLNGSSAGQSEDTNKLIQLYLDSIGDKAGPYKIELKSYNDATPAAAQWDDGQCAQNAAAHVANTQEVAVMGTFNSGCALIEVPILNRASDGPLLMVSHANTNPGLTKAWDPGTPEKYYPTGKRSYARVVTTDDFQGTADADFAKETLHAKSVYILNDNQVYGIGVARAFEDEAKKDGIKVLGNEAWDAKAANYTALFQKIKAKNPDMVFFGGIYDNNGGQLTKDKVAVLGDNKKVPLMVPDGFTGYSDNTALPQAQGEYLSFAGLTLDTLTKNNASGAKLIQQFKQKYGHLPEGSYPLYGVAAMQVILAAIAKSDGTRASVTEQVFSGSGITIPASESVIGKPIQIDPKTGDTNNKDISIELMKNHEETF
ncbi:MAG: branched-chain amino acid ABC transporter substrate-binding protein, partial [Mycobacterium sp.]|nr:branched-chain amino acid ABC transporter substrate-binding protein [Mycobacterium sp.]